MNFRRIPLSAGVYLVATPIGNARDITLRALDVLASADVLAAEDTRTARHLLDIHSVPVDGREILAFHDHSPAETVARLLRRVAEGKSVACLSEAGTPLIADPGFELARDAIAEGAALTAVPGASALLAALSVAGLPTDRFLFLGFLPAQSAARQTVLQDVARIDATLVMYESPRRVREMLVDCVSVFGEGRPAAVCRELTKRFEDVRRGTLGDLRDAIGDDGLRGEVVVVIGRPVRQDVTEDQVRAALTEAMRTMRMKEAATLVAGALGLPRRQVYQLALGLGDRS